jgi:hypothetical protein
MKKSSVYVCGVLLKGGRKESDTVVKYNLEFSCRDWEKPKIISVDMIEETGPEIQVDCYRW